MFLFPVHYISNTFLCVLPELGNAEFWIRAFDVSTPIPFKLTSNRNGTVSKAPLQLVQLWFSLPSFF